MYKESGNRQSVKTRGNAKSMTTFLVQQLNLGEIEDDMKNKESISGNKERPYGSWESPISSCMVTRSKLEFLGICADKENVYWNELRCSEEGRCVICSADKAGNEQEWTPEGFSARTRVHEYGGGDFFVHDKAVYFCNYGDQALYRQSSPTSPPEAVVDNTKQYRYADGRFCSQKSRIICVREDFEVLSVGRQEHANEIVSINPDTKEQHVLVTGADFYMCPRVSPDGTQLVWVQWRHPNMPWDSTEIWVATLCDNGDRVEGGSFKMVVGGTDKSNEPLSVMQPSWTWDGKLLYIGDQTDWWNLYQTKTSLGEGDNLRPVNVEIGGPEWVMGNQPYVQEPDGGMRIITAYDGELGLLHRGTRRYVKISTGFTFHSHLTWAAANVLYCFAYSTTKFEHIIRIDCEKLQIGFGCCCLGKRTSTIVVKPDIIKASIEIPDLQGYFSMPQAMTWETTQMEKSHGWYYPPTHKYFTCPKGELPPLLLRVHEGPTNAFSTILDLELQYFTSRGFAVLLVDHRGSTRYGKKYRHRLKNMWGVFDVDDCCTGAQHLVTKGLVDPERLCVDGTSAGGFTTLACLTFHDVFTAGVCRCGISDLSLLFNETHKFESHYLDTLLAPKGQGGEDLCQERSPINFIDRVNAPMAIFHGDEDEIVPANQAEQMFEVVKSKGKLATYVLFKGEQHGFRKSDNIRVILDGSFYFFSKVLNFESAEKAMQLDIVNLSRPSTNYLRGLPAVRSTFCAVRFQSFDEYFNV